jgi:hypothetical protein
MGVQVMCAGGLPSVSSGIDAGERLLKSGIFLFYFAAPSPHPPTADKKRRLRDYTSHIRGQADQRQTIQLHNVAKHPGLEAAGKTASWYSTHSSYYLAPPCLPSPLIAHSVASVPHPLTCTHKIAGWARPRSGHSC